MSLFSRRRNQRAASPQLDPSVKQNNRFEVLNTIEASSIPRDKLIVTGSSLLALLGLPRKAGDLDAILHPENLEELHQTSQLPSGIAVSEASFSRPGRRHFTTDQTPLPSELFSHHSVLSDVTFEDYLQRQSVPIKIFEDILVDPDIPLDLRVTKPGILYTHKMNRLHVGTAEERALKQAKDAYDRQLLTALGRTAERQ